jgi:1,4-alpha-glucan branching enzyme
LRFDRLTRSESIRTTDLYRDSGYLIDKDLLAIRNATWKEIFNSDAAIYGGRNMGNWSASILSTEGRFNAVVPASGFVVFVKQ